MSIQWNPEAVAGLTRPGHLCDVSFDQYIPLEITKKTQQQTNAVSLQLLKTFLLHNDTQCNMYTSRSCYMFVDGFPNITVRPYNTVKSLKSENIGRIKRGKLYFNRVHQN